MKCRESRVIFAQPTPRHAVPYYVAWAVGTHHPPSVLLGWWGEEDNFMKYGKSKIILHSQRPSVLCLTMWLGLLAPTTHHLSCWGGGEGGQFYEI